MGPLRSALAAARRQRRRRGVFVSLYRPCCGAAAAIARPRQGPAGPPNTHPPARPPSWRRARPPAATEARALATPFSFLCLCPRGRLLARLITLPRPALCPPPLPRRVASAERQSPRLGFRTRFAQESRPSAAARATGPPCSMGVWPWPTPLGLPILQPARSPEPTWPPWELSRLLGGRSQSTRRRRWSPSPPSGAGGAAAAASRGTPELPRAPSARLAELLAPRRCLSGRGDARSPPPPGPAVPPNSRRGCFAGPDLCGPPQWAEKTRVRHQVVFLEPESHSPCSDSLTLCAKRSQRDQNLISV